MFNCFAVPPVLVFQARRKFRRFRLTPPGLAVARLSGRKGGRKPKMTKSKIESAKKLLASGIAAKDVAKNLGVSIPTLYRWVPACDHAEQ